MSKVQSIQIDFDVYQIIVAHQNDFDETPNAVLRRLLGLEATDASATELQERPAVSDAPERNARPPAKGTLRIQQATFHHESAKEALCIVLQQLQKAHRSFLERLSRDPRCIGRIRRTVARRREDLYPGRPDLQTAHSAEIADGWFLGTNTSTSQKIATIRAAADVAGLKLGEDIVVDL